MSSVFLLSIFKVPKLKILAELFMKLLRTAHYIFCLLNNVNLMSNSLSSAIIFPYLLNNNIVLINYSNFHFIYALGLLSFLFEQLRRGGPWNQWIQRSCSEMLYLYIAKPMVIHHQQLLGTKDMVIYFKSK